MPETRSAEIEQLKTLVQELKIQLTAQKAERNDSVELNELRAELSELRSQIVERNPQGGENFKLPDPFKYLSEFSGNKKELSAWLEEVHELYECNVRSLAF